MNARHAWCLSVSRCAWSSAAGWGPCSTSPAWSGRYCRDSHQVHPFCNPFPRVGPHLLLAAEGKRSKEKGVESDMIWMKGRSYDEYNLLWGFGWFKRGFRQSGVHCRRFIIICCGVQGFRCEGPPVGMAIWIVTVGVRVIGIQTCKESAELYWLTTRGYGTRPYE